MVKRTSLSKTLKEQAKQTKTESIETETPKPAVEPVPAKPALTITPAPAHASAPAAAPVAAPVKAFVPAPVHTIAPAPTQARQGETPFNRESMEQMARRRRIIDRFTYTASRLLECQDCNYVHKKIFTCSGVDEENAISRMYVENFKCACGCVGCTIIGAVGWKGTGGR